LGQSPSKLLESESKREWVGENSYLERKDKYFGKKNLLTVVHKKHIIKLEQQRKEVKQFEKVLKDR